MIQDYFILLYKKQGIIHLDNALIVFLSDTVGVSRDFHKQTVAHPFITLSKTIYCYILLWP